MGLDEKGGLDGLGVVAAEGGGGEEGDIDLEDAKDGEGDGGSVVEDDGNVEANSNVVGGSDVSGADDGKEANSDVEVEESLFAFFFRDTPSVMPMTAAAITTSATAISTQFFAMAAVFQTN